MEREITISRREPANRRWNTENMPRFMQVVEHLVTAKKVLNVLHIGPDHTQDFVGNNNRSIVKGQIQVDAQDA